MSKYRFEMYERGKVIFDSGDMDLAEAKKFFMANYNSSSALRLFVDGEKIPYGQTHKFLKLSASQRFQVLDAPLIPHTVRG